MKQRKLYRVPQAVEYLGSVVTVSMLRNWILLRKIETVRIGRIVCIPEDALDKLIGAMAKGRSRFDGGLTLLTSRASCEMVQKAATIGMTIVAAISAPTGLAIRLAEQSGVTLIGFARDRTYAVYANPGRIINRA